MGSHFSTVRVPRSPGNRLKGRHGLELGGGASATGGPTGSHTSNTRTPGRPHAASSVWAPSGLRLLTSSAHQTLQRTGRAHASLGGTVTPRECRLNVSLEHVRNACVFIPAPQTQTLPSVVYFTLPAQGKSLHFATCLP